MMVGMYIKIFKQIMSTSQLFAVRNKLLKNSLQQFRKIVQQQKIRLDINDISNLFLAVYQSDSLRKQMIQYLSYFASYDRSILNIQIANRRRLLQDICFHARTDDIRELIVLFSTHKVSLRLYNINKLIRFALDGKNSQQSIVAVINELASCRRMFPEGEEDEEQSADSYLCISALTKEMLLPAFQILKNGIGRLDSQLEELFILPTKVGKKQVRLLEDFVRLYLEKTKCNPYFKDNHGKTFLERLPKEYQNGIEEIIRIQQKRIEPRQNVRRSQHKVRSSMGPGQNLKQYNAQALQESSRQKMVINIQTSQDEFSIQKEANKVYQNFVNDKEKYFRYEKKQRKEGQEKQKRVGIMKSQQLRYYLEEDIKHEVQAIKQENRQYKRHFQDLIHILKQKLSVPLLINLEVFGSFRTQLCLPQSDIDIAITSENQQQANPLKLLGEIEYILQQQQMKENIQSVKFIKTATVPIIKVTCTEKYWRKKIDFTYQDGAHNGLQSVNLICQYLNEYPQLQPLIFVLKKFIYLSGLSAPYLGGISSYGLILMIVAFIQQEQKAHQGKSESKLLVADLLIGFLKFYGFRMNYVMKSVQIFDKSKGNWQGYTGCVSRYNQPNNIIDVTPKLVIIDPLNENNNVGRATHKVKQIQMAFQIAYISLHTFRQCGRKRKCESYRKISKVEISDIKYAQNVRPCCILKRMFSCTEKFIKE